MLKFFLILLFSFSIACGQKVALLVGVKDVRGANPLFVDADLKIMEELLKNSGFEIISLKNATLEKVREKLRSFYTLNSDDTFLFYYTGHGAIMKGINQNESNDNFFVLNQTSFIGNDTIGGGVLTDNEYSMHLHMIKAKKVSIIDACHSASLYKSIGDNPLIKSISAKGEGTIFNRASTIENFQSRKPDNLLNISAALDSEQAENSPIGSIFTVGLADLIKNNPNMTFKRLERKLVKQMPLTASTLAHKLLDTHPMYAGLKGTFTPNINAFPNSFKNIKIKDVFSKESKISLENVLNHNFISQNKITMQTVGNKKEYRNNQLIGLNIVSKIKNGYLYLFENKKEKYMLLAKQNLNNCSGTRTKFCKFRNIVATSPFGKSKLYAVVTKNELMTDNQSLTKDFDISASFFDTEDLATQIKRERIDGVELVLWVIG